MEEISKDRDWYWSSFVKVLSMKIDGDIDVMINKMKQEKGRRK